MAENKRPDDAMPDSAPAPAPAPVQRVRPMMPEEIRQEEARAQADIMAEAMERNATDEHEGGRYMVGDQLVDANGEPIKDKKD